jgi:hypothetical protein
MMPWFFIFLGLNLITTVLACNSDQAEMWGCFVGSQISMASLIQTYYSENGFVSSGGSFEWRFLFLNSLYYFVL